jgi:hypothetical protein
MVRPTGLKENVQTSQSKGHYAIKPIFFDQQTNFSRSTLVTILKHLADFSSEKVLLRPRGTLSCHSGWSKK